MTSDAALALLATVTAAIGGLASWTLWQAHSLAVRVAVLEREGTHADRGMGELREQLSQVETRLGARMSAVEEGLGRRLDALAACVHRLDGSPRPTSDG